MRAVDVITLGVDTNFYCPLPYGLYQTQVSQLLTALQQAEVRARQIGVHVNTVRDEIDQLFHDAPQWTISFGKTRVRSRRHVNLMWDQPFSFSGEVSDEEQLFAFADRALIKECRSLFAHEPLFVPPAIEKIDEPTADRPIALGMFASWYDPTSIVENLERYWDATEMIEKAAKRVVEEGIAVPQAFQKGIFLGLNPVTFYFLAECLAKTYARRRMMQLGPIHVFGSTRVPHDIPQSRSWWKDEKQPTLTCRGPLHADEVHSAMQQCAFILDPSPHIGDGVHLRVLQGLSAGAMVVAWKNPYLEEEFGDAIVFFDPQNPGAAQEEIARLLQAPQERVERIKSINLHKHTWKTRTHELLDRLYSHPQFV